jgi:type IV secretory pathway VirB2 component (pilin)
MTRTLRDLATVLGAFAASSAIAAALGAANFGTALAFGQMGFALALVWVLLRA